MIVYQNFAECLAHIDNAESLTTWRRSPGVNTALANLQNRQGVLDQLAERAQTPPPSLRNTTADLLATWGSSVVGARHALDMVTRQLGDFEREVIAAMRAQHDPIRDALAEAIGTARQAVYDQCDVIERKYRTLMVVNGEFGGNDIDELIDSAELDQRVAAVDTLAAFAQHYGLTVVPGRILGVQTTFSKKFHRLDRWLSSLQVRSIEVYPHPALTRDEYPREGVAA